MTDLLLPAVVLIGGAFVGIVLLTGLGKGAKSGLLWAIQNRASTILLALWIGAMIAFDDLFIVILAVGLVVILFRWRKRHQQREVVSGKAPLPEVRQYEALPSPVQHVDPAETALLDLIYRGWPELSARIGLAYTDPTMTVARHAYSRDAESNDSGVMGVIGRGLALRNLNQLENQPGYVVVGNQMYRYPQIKGTTRGVTGPEIHFESIDSRTFKDYAEATNACEAAWRVPRIVAEQSIEDKANGVIRFRIALRDLLANKIMIEDFRRGQS